MARKTSFYLTPQNTDYRATRIDIVGKFPSSKAKISVYVPGTGEIGYISGADLERFAVNILKALGSKKLALSQRYNSKDFFSKKKKLKK